jgi:hypothetical protein
MAGVAEAWLLQRSERPARRRHERELGGSFKPAKVDATPERIAQVKAHPDFKVMLFPGGLCGIDLAQSQAQAQPIPDAAMVSATSKAFGVPLAKDRAESSMTGAFSVTSRDFAPNGMMPAAMSAYAEAASPQLAWTPVPKARSYIVMAV